MKFLREIPESKIVQKVINDLEQCGLTLVWKEDSVEVWGDTVEPTELRVAA